MGWMDKFSKGFKGGLGKKARDSKEQEAYELAHDSGNSESSDDPGNKRKDARARALSRMIGKRRKKKSKYSGDL